MALRLMQRIRPPLLTVAALATVSGGPLQGQAADGIQDEAATAPRTLHTYVRTHLTDPVFQLGQTARIYYGADEGAFVSVLRLDTSGQPRLVHPRSPARPHWVQGLSLIHI